MRLFVAINFPPDLRREIWDAAGTLRAGKWPVRWTPQDEIHLTLKFLGEVEPSRRETVEQGVVDAVHGTRKFLLPFSDIGAFPNAERPKVVWVGCEGVPALELLQDRMERVMASLGFPIEGRPFRPHVTLGRVKESRGRWKGFETALDRVTYDGESLVQSIELMESRTSPAGARYSALRSVSLAD